MLSLVLDVGITPLQAIDSLPAKLLKATQVTFEAQYPINGEELPSSKVGVFLSPGA